VPDSAGRAGKPELTDRLIAEFVNKLRISGSVDTALKTCGISRETYDRLVDAVAVGGGGDLQGRRLVEEAASAEGETKLIREHQLSQYFEKDWRALAWWLEHKYPGEYGRPEAPESDFDALLDFKKPWK
jgi:hypothetical protein